MVLQESDKEAIQKKFVGLADDVELIVFSQELECQFCKETREMVLDLGTLSKKIKVKIFDFVKDADEVLKYNIKKIPGHSNSWKNRLWNQVLWLYLRDMNCRS